MLRSVVSVRTALGAALGLASFACGGQSLYGLDAGDDGGDAGDGSVVHPALDAAGSPDANPGLPDTGVVTLPDAGPPNPDAGSTKCLNPTPILVGGQDTGYDLCAGGVTRRRAIKTCPSLLPRTTPNPCDYDGGVQGACRTDQDCTSVPYGLCNPNQAGCYCQGGCVADSDCPSGEICECGDPVGACVPADCNAGTCAPGFDCADFTANPGCPGKTFACTTPQDTCFSDSDCDGGACSLTRPSGTSRSCQPIGCAIGRPFLVDDEPRLPSVVARQDWSASCDPDLALSPSLRARLAAEWTRIARMEHASIAAFARFTLQLVALGAPHDLVAQAGRAMADETEHARLAFGLASAYGGEAIGPGPLAVDGSLAGIDLLQLVETTFLEGCVGETVAAVEAREALERATDPRVREVLEIIARDETRHAALAWKTVAWALRVGGDDVRRALARASERVLGEDQGAERSDEADLLPHGVMGEGLRRQLRKEVIREIVVPCVQAMATPAPAPLDHLHPLA
jgi:hypothetical protein